MPATRLLLVGAVATLLVTFLPGGAAASQEVPICHPTFSSKLCYYAYDPGNCFVDPNNHVRYCQTLAFYYWQS